MVDNRRGGAPFIGRRRELRRIGEAWDAGERLVTVLGTAGIGKTRLALEAGADERARVVCRLDDARTLEDLLAEVAAELGLGAVASTPATERIERALARGAPLLILDGFDRLVGHAAATLRRWLARAPELRCLVTSRRALGLDEELRVEVGPLAVDEGVALFIAQARRTRPGWSPDAAEATIVADIIHRLDGIPLAIKLCAARGTVLSPAELHARLAARFELLDGGPDDPLNRHRSLQAALDGSWELLSPRERDALAACAVLRGSFDAAAAEAVIGGAHALDALQVLRDSSLVRVVDGGRGAAVRFALFDSVCAYASERLVPGARAAAEARAAAHYRGLIAQGATAAMLHAERENLLLAVEHLIGVAPEGAAALLLALHDVLVAQERRDRQLALLGAAIAALRARGGGAAIAPLLVARADILRLAGRLAEAERAAEDARAAAGDEPVLADALRVLGDVRRARGDSTAAAADLEMALGLARRSGDRRREGLVRLALASLRYARRELAATDEEARAAYAIWSALGDPAQQAAALTARGVVLLDHDRPGEARAVLEEADRAYRSVGHRPGEGRVVIALAAVAWAQGRLDDAAGLAARALELHEVQGAHPWSEMDLAVLAMIDVARGRPEEALAHARRAAAAMGPGEFVRIRAMVEGALGIAEASCGGLAAAEEAIARARASVVGLEAVLRGFVDAAAAFLESARAARARADGDEAAAAAAQARAEAGLAAATAAAGTSHDVRGAIRLVRAALAGLRGDAPAVVLAEAAPRASGALRIGADGRWFALPGGGRVALERPAWSRLLVGLARRRLERPAEGLTTDELFAHGWPDERALQHAARNRVWVALAKLRGLGLEPLIVRRGGRYLLDPAVEVRIEPGA